MERTVTGTEIRSLTAVAPDALTEAPGYPGIVREVACASERAIHGSRPGSLGVRESVEVVEGGYFHVPAGVVNRDVNPSDESQEFVLVFAGGGRLVVDVDGPDPA